MFTSSLCFCMKRDSIIGLKTMDWRQNISGKLSDIYVSCVCMGNEKIQLLERTMHADLKPVMN